VKTDSYSNDMSSKGFTLVEFSVVMTIFALLVGSAILLYAQYYERKKVEKNISSIMEMEEAIKAFFFTEGRFPCPGPLTANVGDSNYGMELNCQNTAPSPDYNLAVHTFDIDGDGSDENVRVRIGTFPFRTVFERLADHAMQEAAGTAPKKTSYTRSIDAGSVLDAYSRQFTYVVTEEQATPGYKDRAGAIEIYDEHGELIAERMNFVLVSHGDNGAGAITTEGTLYRACDLAAVEGENCDNDHIFTAGLRTEASGTDFYDDVVSQLQYIPFYLWDQTAEGSSNIINENLGNVGINVTDPEERLHVDGNMTAWYFWDGFGSAFSEKLCAENAGVWDEDCFSAEVIAGTLDPDHLDPVNDDENNDDIACPPGTLMKRIVNGRTQAVGDQEGDVDCFEIEYGNANTNCAANEYVKQVSYDFGNRELIATCTVDTGTPPVEEDEDADEDTPQDTVSEYRYCQQNPDSSWCNDNADQLIALCRLLPWISACRTD